jgi:hypothetical protein
MSGADLPVIDWVKLCLSAAIKPTTRAVGGDPNERLLRFGIGFDADARYRSGNVGGDQRLLIRDR